MREETEREKRRGTRGGEGGREEGWEGEGRRGRGENGKEVRNTFSLKKSTCPKSLHVSWQIFTFVLNSLSMQYFIRGYRGEKGRRGEKKDEGKRRE